MKKTYAILLSLIYLVLATGHILSYTSCTTNVKFYSLTGQEDFKPGKQCPLCAHESDSSSKKKGCCGQAFKVIKADDKTAKQSSEEYPSLYYSAMLPGTGQKKITTFLNGFKTCIKTTIRAKEYPVLPYPCTYCTASIDFDWKYTAIGYASACLNYIFLNLKSP